MVDWLRTLGMETWVFPHAQCQKLAIGPLSAYNARGSDCDPEGTDIVNTPGSGSVSDGTGNVIPLHRPEGSPRSSADGAAVERTPSSHRATRGTPSRVRGDVVAEHEPTFCPTLEDVFAAAPVLGVRRLMLIGIQLATELQLAQESRVALLPLTATTVLLQRSSTPFEQASLARDPFGVFQDSQEVDGLRALGWLLSELLRKRLFLEDSVRDASGRFGGAPLPRAADLPILNGLHRGISTISLRCEGKAARPYSAAPMVIEDLSKLARLVNRIIAARRPVPPETAVSLPVPCVPPAARLPKLLLNVPRSQVRFSHELQ
jgi:hypothetical protein